MNVEIKVEWHTIGECWVGRLVVDGVIWLHCTSSRQTLAINTIRRRCRELIKALEAAMADSAVTPDADAAPAAAGPVSDAGAGVGVAGS